MLYAHLVIFLFAVALLPLRAAQADDSTPALIATRITAENFSSLALRGPDALGGIGDWALSNGRLCATLSDLPHQTYLSARGGTLIDLGHCGRADDQWSTYHEQFNLAKDLILPVESIDAVVANGAASIRVRASMAGVQSSTRYTLRSDDPDALFIETRLERVAEGTALQLFGSLILHPKRSLTPFAIDTRSAANSKGFHHPYVDTRNKLAVVRAIHSADLHVLVGATHLPPGISYGVQALGAHVQRANGEVEAVQQFATGNENFTLLGCFSEPLFFGAGSTPGFLAFLQSRFMDLELGDTLVVKRRILVGARSDVASITDRLYKGSVISGRVDNPAAGVHVADASGQPITFVQPNENGEFTAKLPVGLTGIQLRVETPSNSILQEHAIDAPRIELGLIHTGDPARLHLPQIGPARLVFIGIDGTPDPRIFDDGLDFRVDGAPYPNSLAGNSLSLAGIAEDIRELELPPGSYRVLATRGPEFSVSETSLVLRAGETAELEIEAPRRVLETRGWISADFHVHSAQSFDSTLPAARRLIEFVAQGGEVLVPSEHKISVDFHPLVAKLGLQELLRVINGVELTGMAQTAKVPRTLGHANLFPVDVDPRQFAGGTLPHEDRRLGTVIGESRQRDPDAIFQLNHPRSTAYDNDIAFFEHLSDGVAYEPRQPLSSDANRRLIEPRPPQDMRDLDFDAMELLSGEGMESYATVREDWFSLLRQGWFKTATANSDSHGSAELVALPRNYVALSEDSVARFDQAAFLASVKRGRLYGTTGPLLQVSFEGVGMGETFTGREGALRLRVDAAAWVTVDTMRVYENGALAMEHTISAGETLDLPMQFDEDAFLTVEVSGPAGEIYSLINPGHRPFAFTNPIFVDADGDGAWRPRPRE